MLLRFATTTMLVLGVAVPSALAQQVDPQAKQAAEMIGEKWVEAINKGDSKTAMSLFTPEGFEINVYGREERGQMEQVLHMVHSMGVNLTTRTTEVKSLASGQLLLASGTFNVTYSNNPTTKTAEGNWMRLLAKEGSEWKIVAQGLTRQAPPPAATGSTTPPSK